MAIRQARLEPLALCASCHKRMQGEKKGQALRGSFVAEDVFHGFIAVAL